MPIRRAKAIRMVLEEMTINIWEDELIVGNHAPVAGRVPFSPNGAFTGWRSSSMKSRPGLRIR